MSSLLRAHHDEIYTPWGCEITLFSALLRRENLGETNQCAAKLMTKGNPGKTLKFLLKCARNSAPFKVFVSVPGAQVSCAVKEKRHSIERRLSTSDETQFGLAWL